MGTLDYSACFDPAVDILALDAEIDPIFWRSYHQASSGVQAYELVKALLFFTAELDLLAAFLSFLLLSCQSGPQS